jgi:hypothetical protein
MGRDTLKLEIAKKCEGRHLVRNNDFVLIIFSWLLSHAFHQISEMLPVSTLVMLQ